MSRIGTVAGGRATSTRAAAAADGGSGSGTAGQPGAGVRWRWSALVAICLSVLVIGLDSMVLMVALPTLAVRLRASSGDLEWMQDSYLLLFAGLMLPFGALGDRIGRKRLLTMGLVFFGIASAFSAEAGSPAELIAMRALMGVGAAVIMPLSMSVVPAMFPPAERPKAIGILTAGMAIGLPLGPIIGGVLLEHLWWGSVFLINVPVIALAVLGVWLLVPESRDPVAPRLDVAGAALSTVGLVAVVYAIIEMPSRGWADGAVLACAVGGLAVLMTFVWWQRRAKAPLAPLGLLRSRGFGVGTLTVSVVSFALFGVLFTVPQYLQQVRAASVLGSGLRLLPMMVTLLVGSLASEKAAARWGARIMATAGMVLVSIALVVLATLRSTSGYAPLATGLALIGLGLGCTMAPAMNAVLGALPPARTGSGSALNSALKQVAGAAGVAVLGSVLASTYRGSLAPSLRGLPEPVVSAARSQLAGASSAADRIGGAAGQHLLGAARAAFTHGMSMVMLVSAAVVLAGAVMTAFFLPARPETSSAD